MSSHGINRTDPGAGHSALVEQAQQMASDGRVAEAEAAWRAILADYADSLAAVTGLVKLLDRRGARAEAEAVLRSLIQVAPTHANVLASARQWEAWQDTPQPGARTIRIALTGTGTLAPVGGHLSVVCAQAGLHPFLYLSPFSQWAQDLLPTDSPLYASSPELIILLLDPASLFPRLLAEMAAPEEVLAAEQESGLAAIAQALGAAQRNAPAATIVLHTFSLPDYSPLGILDLRQENGQRARIEALNAALASLVRTSYPQVLLFDQERVEARHGKARVRDDRLWYLAGIPFSDSFLPIMAAEYLRLIRPIMGLTRKCVVLDLDNTLWGGVIGEDGIDQIRLGGTTAPGNAFHDFQLRLAQLRERGILLALCSKNNPEDVWPVLDGHPHMVLRRNHFAAVRINWIDKATNLAHLASELNLGLDSVVFMDDNPAERALVRQQLPEVLTVELPRDPALYARTLLGLDVFESLDVTAEDRRRSQLYQEQQTRRQYQALAVAGDLSGYLAGLEMTVQIRPATGSLLPRITQLLNKTNQFNLTTRRYTEAQVRAMMSDPDEWSIYAASVADRFGDSGLTGVAIVRKSAEIWEIDSLLLSCRVLGRGVEDALLTFLIRQARQAGVTGLRGICIPTERNLPAQSFYEGQQFVRMELSPAREGETRWRLDPGAGIIRDYPDWLRVEIVDH